jgi:hypothetical protein
MKEKNKILFLWLTPLFTVVTVLAVNYFWLHPPLSQTTLNLRNRLRDVTEVRVRVGCITDKSGSPEKIILKLQGKAAQDFIGMLQVHLDRRVFTPAACNPYTFEFYQNKKFVTEIAYFPNLLSWRDGKTAGAAWGDGGLSWARPLNYNTRKYLARLLALYEKSSHSLTS